MFIATSLLRAFNMLIYIIYIQEGAIKNEVAQAHLAMESLSEGHLKEPMVHGTPSPSTVVFKLLKSHRTLSSNYFLYDVSIYVKQIKSGWDNTNA